MRRYSYYRLLEVMPTHALAASVCTPAPYMNKTHIALHLIALRNRGALHTVNYLEQNQ